MFGSRASGEAWEYSDYDFIIVSDAFRQVHWLERISKVVRHWTSDRPIDVLPYTQSEFEEKKKNSSVVQEAVRKGISI
ncbi:nucleotidyltransferase domain-containing protein [Candidatus Woesearchaeota archaeon]|nr:nucleotidyltransferase domain-containing protein [Candidatus Woesearchaeota archaeon]